MATNLSPALISHRIKTGAPLFGTTRRFERYQRVIDLIDLYLDEVRVLIEKHELRLLSRRPTDRRYHLKEVQDGKIRLRSLQNLREEVEAHQTDCQAIAETKEPPQAPGSAK